MHGRPRKALFCREIMKFTPLRQQSTFSILKALGQPEDIVKKYQELGCESIGFTEEGNLFSYVKFFKECKQTKPLIGCDFFVKNEQGLIGKVLVYPKNQDGLKELFKAISEAYLFENIILDKPCLSLTKLAEYAKGNFLIITGSLYTEIGESLFKDKTIHLAQDYKTASLLVLPDWDKILYTKFNQYFDLFGKENVYGEILWEQSVYGSQILAKILQSRRNKLGIKLVATNNPFYINKEDAEDHRILLCTKLQTTLKDFENEAVKRQELDLLKFFRSSSHFIQNPYDLKSQNETFNEEFIKNTLEFSSRISSFEILKSPKIPSFTCPDGMSPGDYLRKLCLEGWDKKVKGKVPASKYSEYAERAKHELGVINSVNLAGYFLIIHDIMSWIRSQGWKTEPRGSVGGSLVAHLSNITNIDPIRAELIFERFWNPSRAKVGLPDIDLDVPVRHRDSIIEHVAEKYGKDKVSHICTFGTMKGRSTIKDILRAKNACSFEEQNKITSYIPDEGKISGKLQEMAEEEGESSIIKWSLMHVPKLKEWCQYKENPDGSYVLEGELWTHFAQAIRLEGCIRSHGKHAAGIIIADDPLSWTCPIIQDGNESKAGLDMNDLEAIGHVKMDILGVKAIDDVMLAEQLINSEIYE